jgi:hypothetical protein
VAGGETVMFFFIFINFYKFKIIIIYIIFLLPDKNPALKLEATGAKGGHSPACKPS